MIILLTVVIFLLSYEAIMWGWTLNRHAVWIEKHIKDRRKLLVSFNMLKIASVMSSILSVGAWMWWLVVISSAVAHSGHIIVCAILISAIQLSHIHFSVILARYACLPRSFWSIFSQLASIFLCSVFNLKEPILTSGDLHICWGEDFDQC